MPLTIPPNVDGHHAQPTTRLSVVRGQGLVIVDPKWFVESVKGSPGDSVPPMLNGAVGKMVAWTGVFVPLRDFQGVIRGQGLGQDVQHRLGKHCRACTLEDGGAVKLLAGSVPTRPLLLMAGGMCNGPDDGPSQHRTEGPGRVQGILNETVGSVPAPELASPRRGIWLVDLDADDERDVQVVVNREQGQHGPARIDRAHRMHVDVGIEPTMVPQQGVSQKVGAENGRVRGKEMVEAGDRGQLVGHQA